MERETRDLREAPATDLAEKPPEKRHTADDLKQIPELQQTSAQLWGENNQLLQTNEGPHSHVSVLTNMPLTEQHKTLDSLNRRKHIFNHPFPEILRIIFGFALPPSFLLDSSISRGPESPWCQALRAKQSITQVCTIWHQVGVEFLYEDIVLRRMSQVAALSRTLKDDSCLGGLIKNITIRPSFPLDDLTVFTTELKSIVERCHHLTGIFFPLHPVQFFPLTLCTVPSSITHFEYGGCGRFSDFMVVLSHICGNLVSLSFLLPDSAEGMGSKVSNLHFDRLELLECALGGSSDSYLPAVARTWTMPRLRSLTFDLVRDGCNTSTLMDFCRIHGCGLTYLQLHSSWGCDWPHVDICNIVKETPVLEHLVLPDDDVHPSSHQTLKWIDVWLSTGRRIHFSRNLEDQLKSRRFPSLERYRVLDTALAAFTQLPSMIPPYSPTSDIKYPGVHIRNGPGGVYRQDLLYTGEDGWSLQGLDYAALDNPAYGVNLPDFDDTSDNEDLEGSIYDISSLASDFDDTSDIDNGSTYDIDSPTRDFDGASDINNAGCACFLCTRLACETAMTRARLDNQSL